MIDVTLLTPEKILFEGKAKSVIFPGESGVFEVLPFHKPLLSRLVSGKVIIDASAFSIWRGIAGVNRNKATIIVEE
jgi:F-type H+-transporting ATPase subunit epsilon